MKENKEHESGIKKFTYYIYARLNYYDELVFDLSDTEWGDTYPDRILVHEINVRHALPDYEDLLPKFVAGLEVKKQAMVATASAAVAEVEAKIQSLLVLEHKA